MPLWLVSQIAAQSVPANQQAHIQRIQDKTVDLTVTPGEPPLQMTLQELMKLYKVPGLSIAVIDNYKIIWAKAYGVTDAGSNTPVTTTTLFQAGSISKPVAATAALYLVQQGKLSLDEDVNQKLKTWKVPENQFTTTQKVTLRRLMSHTAGLTIHGFPGYDVDAPIPTLVQIFNTARSQPTQHPFAWTSFRARKNAIPAAVSPSNNSSSLTPPASRSPTLCTKLFYKKSA